MFSISRLITVLLLSIGVPVHWLPAQDPLGDLFRDTPAERERLEQVELSAADERQFGEQIFQQYVVVQQQQGIEVTNRGRDARYLQSLVGQLRPLMQHANRYASIQLWVAASDDPDARSVPGGWVVITRGLLEFATSEAAVVGVLAHELSHIDRGHQTELPRRWKLAQQTLTSGQFQPDQWLQSGRLLANQFARPFRPEQESEADADAVRWLVASGYDALELAQLFEQMRQREQAAPLMLPGFLRSHPAPADRSQAVQRQLHELQPELARRKLDAYRGRENLRRRIPRTQRRFAE